MGTKKGRIYGKWDAIQGGVTEFWGAVAPNFTPLDTSLAL